MKVNRNISKNDKIYSKNEIEKRQSRAQQQAAQDVREPVYAAEEPAGHDGRHQNQAGEFRQRPQRGLFHPVANLRHGRPQ